MPYYAVDRHPRTCTATSSRMRSGSVPDRRRALTSLSVGDQWSVAQRFAASGVPADPRPMESTMPDAFQWKSWTAGSPWSRSTCPTRRSTRSARRCSWSWLGLVEQLEQRSDLRGCSSERQARPVHRRGRPERAGRSGLRHATSRSHGRIAFGHQLFSRLSRPAVPDGRADRRQLPGRRDRADPGDGRAHRLDRARTPRSACPRSRSGILPGWGGTQRLPRLIGLNAAIEMISSGEPVSAQKAAALGLAFDAVPAEQLVEEGQRGSSTTSSRAASGRAAPQRREQPLGLEPGPDDVRLRRSPRGSSRARPRASTPPPWWRSRRSARAAT